MKLKIIISILLFVIYAHPHVQQSSSDMVINYFDKLVADNVLSIEHVRNLAEHETLQNPIVELEAYADSKLLTVYKTINTLLTSAAAKSAASGNNVIDHSMVKTWAGNKLAELEDNARDKEAVHEDTREVHRPMRFVPIPTGKYISEVDGAEFEISTGIEMQETEVTKYQWATVIGGNLVEIEKTADYPMVDVSYSEIQKFIHKKNEQDEVYEYRLSSVREYEALLQGIVGKNWHEKVKQMRLRLESDSSVGVGATEYMLHNSRRIWDIIGNVWEFTRDANVFGKEQARLVFGGGYATKYVASHSIQDVLRPVVFNTTSDKAIGFRLVRIHKNSASLESIVYSLVWDEDYVQQDAVWQWNATGTKAWVWAGVPATFLVAEGDYLSCMIAHKDTYSEEKRLTIERILRSVSYAKNKPRELKQISSLNLNRDATTWISDLSPLFSLKQLKSLSLIDGRISDLSPLSGMTQLEELILQGNSIQDINLLSGMKKLKKLNLCHNQITDISALAGLMQLEDLELFRNKIIDISPLSGLDKLKYLSLHYNKITDISPLFGLNQLIDLRITGDNPIPDNQLKILRNKVGLLL